MLTASNDIFNSIKALRPKRHAFNLSYRKKFDCDMGQLIPICCEEVVSGDKFKVGNECVVRMQPLVAPILDSIKVKTEYFYVPFRILWEDFEDFFTGGEDGDYSALVPCWNYDPTADLTTFNNLFINEKGSLGDYFGLPFTSSSGVYLDRDSLYPNGFAQYAYNMIWNEYYRDENIDQEVELNNNIILYRRWKKDYFTSALPFQQRGTAPTLPITLTQTNSIKKDPSGTTLTEFFARRSSNTYPINSQSTDGYPLLGAFHNEDGTELGVPFSNNATVNPINANYRLLSVSIYSNFINRFIQDPVFTTEDAINVSDLRLMFQVQKWMERQARGGARFNETLLSHFGVSPSDSRLQRPEYLGGTSQPLFVSEVLQTSSTDSTSPQGNLAGRGLSVAGGYVFNKTFPEPGLVIGLMSIVPELTYSADGIDKTWTRKSRFDYYFPEFAHLSEQKVFSEELFVTGSGSESAPEKKSTTFGYQGIYDEYRHKRSIAVGNMRDTFDYWSLFRKFESQPVLNSSFLEMVPSKRIFAVQDESGFIVNFANIIKAIRPIPKFAEPGMNF